MDDSPDGCRYKKQSGHETCKVPDLLEGESEDGVIWDCDDNFEAGSKCEKRCNAAEGWALNDRFGAKSLLGSTRCICKGSCRMAQIKQACTRRGCFGPPPLTDFNGSDPTDGLIGHTCVDQKEINNYHEKSHLLSSTEVDFDPFTGM